MINQEIIDKLKNWNNTNEGALFNNTAVGIQEQLNLIDKIFNTYLPKQILEIGTNKGYFDYYILENFPEIVSVDTFDEAEFSRDIISYLNNLYNSRINFHIGSSLRTFIEFNPPYKIDLAFVDGSHDHVISRSDILRCLELGIPNILLDDYEFDGVKNTAKFLIETQGYKIELETDESIDDRHMKFLRKTIV